MLGAHNAPLNPSELGLSLCQGLVSWDWGLFSVSGMPRVRTHQPMESTKECLITAYLVQPRPSVDTELQQGYVAKAWPCRIVSLVKFFNA